MGAQLGFDAAALWRPWAPDLDHRLTGAGHFMAEEAPDEIAAAITDLVARWAGPARGRHADGMGTGIRTVAGAAAAVGALGAGYLGLVTGAVPVDLGIGRRTRPLGPFGVDIRAPAATVFDVLSEPYLGRRTRAAAEKIDILERGSDMVLAAHRTPVRGRLVATTVETVRFTRPDRIDFRLARGPVPYVVEQFRLTATADGTRLDYSGELGTDLWAVGARWGERVAGPWERTVRATFRAVRTEAERRADRPQARRED